MSLFNVVTYKELWLLNVPEKPLNRFSLRRHSLGPKKCVMGNLSSVATAINLPPLYVEMCLYTGDAA